MPILDISLTLTVHKTTDGGTNLGAINRFPGVGNFEKVKAFDANNVYAVGNTGGLPTLVFSIKLPMGEQPGHRYPHLSQQVSFFDQDWVDMNNGVIVGTLGLILKTSDGGTTWTVMNTGGWTVYDVQMISADNFYVAGREWTDIQIWRCAGSNNIPVNSKRSKRMEYGIHSGITSNQPECNNLVAG